MKSRMEKYYRDEDTLQRTAKNTELYDTLYKEKQDPDSNVTFIDNVSEIDVEKIKDMINSREEYKKLKQYEEIVRKVEPQIDRKKDYELGELDDNSYDINKIIEEKRKVRTEEEDPNKVRKLCEVQYEELSKYSCSDEDIIEYNDREKSIKELIDTMTDSTDLFANLKETEEESRQETKIVKESTFYTNTVSFDNEDFNDEKDPDFIENKSSPLLKIIIFISFIAAIGVFVWFKFFA